MIVAHTDMDRVDKWDMSIADYPDRKPDMVNHPKHYISKKGIEVIDVIDAFTEDLTGIEAFDTGNTIKYICRWKHKNGVEDLKKARFYIEHLINHIEKETNNHE